MHVTGLSSGENQQTEKMNMSQPPIKIMVFGTGGMKTIQLESRTRSDESPSRRSDNWLEGVAEPSGHTFSSMPIKL